MIDNNINKNKIQNEKEVLKNEYRNFNEDLKKTLYTIVIYQKQVEKSGKVCLHQSLLTK